MFSAVASSGQEQEAGIRMNLWLDESCQALPSVTSSSERGLYIHWNRYSRSAPGVWNGPGIFPVGFDGNAARFLG